MAIHSPGFAAGLLDPFVGGDAGANKRRGVRGRKAGRHMGDVIRVRQEVLGKAAVPGIAAELGFGAHRFPALPRQYSQ